jgi:saxitoxin biosynthesis operon SxtJ-like protein
MDGGGGLATRVPARLSARAGRLFGLQVGAAFLVLGAVASWRGHPRSAVVLGALGGALVVGGLLVPDRMDPIYRGWMRLAAAISKVTTPVVMGALYFLVLTPTGLLLRAFGHRALAPTRGASSAWVPRDATRGGRSDLKHQF